MVKKWSGYRLPNYLNQFQRTVYCAAIDWKREHICEEAGFCLQKKGSEYVRQYNDALIPDNMWWRWQVPPMIYEGIREGVEQMQQSDYGYTFHNYAYHVASSQTACVNFFFPLLMHDAANDLLRPLAPEGFDHIDRTMLYHGFQFEYGAVKEYAGREGILGDCWHGTGTDADLVVAYRDAEGHSCLWMLEFKLTEERFTKCGAASSAYNKTKHLCRSNGMAELTAHPDRCHYHSYCHFRYWEIMQRHADFFQGTCDADGCPFSGGINQLWRNQLLAFAIEDAGYFHRVDCAVVLHPGNTKLLPVLADYERLIGHHDGTASSASRRRFSRFTYLDFLHHPLIGCDAGLSAWRQWMQQVYAIRS